MHQTSNNSLFARRTRKKYREVRPGIFYPHSFTPQYGYPKVKILLKSYPTRHVPSSIPPAHAPHSNIGYAALPTGIPSIFPETRLTSPHLTQLPSQRPGPTRQPPSRPPCRAHPVLSHPVLPSTHKTRARHPSSRAPKRTEMHRAGRASRELLHLAGVDTNARAGLRVWGFV